MLSLVWDTIGQRLADRWIALWTPAFAFWAVGLLAWVYHEPSGWTRLEALARGWPGLLQAALGAGCLALVALSALLVQRVTVPLLRALEGYWPRPLDPLRIRLTARQRVRLHRYEARAQQLRARLEQDPDSAEVALDLVRLDERIRRFPVGDGRCMPTRLGNILRAAETAPLDKYGLDPVRCWSRLWLVLPDGARTEVDQARATLDIAVTVQMWGVLFLLWTPWAWWALLLGLVVAGAAWPWVVSSAQHFGDLLEAVFDLHRSALYEAAHWPMPYGAVDEARLGRALTTYLWTGQDTRS